ncbi:DUF456 domain-containing protein [Lysobacter hankyongensis]|uniref:DUF456 domain-containing protein n=1 Tax=Lysobacter hankyongensis TaxID=1176535 RepID=A0ABP9CB32_9GAMM
MEQQVLFYILAAVLIVVGLLGVILPALPGLPLVYGGMLLAAWTDGFERISVITLVVLGILTLLSLLIDFIATAMGAKRVGASRWAVVGAAVGTIAGLFFGFVGVFVAPFIGAVVGELLYRRKMSGNDLGDAAKIGLGTWLGIIFGVVVKLTLGFAMLGLFFFAWFF